MVGGNKVCEFLESLHAAQPVLGSHSLDLWHGVLCTLNPIFSIISKNLFIAFKSNGKR